VADAGGGARGAAAQHRGEEEVGAMSPGRVPVSARRRAGRGGLPASRPTESAVRGRRSPALFRPR
jgi:hypothetical protein